MGQFVVVKFPTVLPCFTHPLKIHSSWTWFRPGIAPFSTPKSTHGRVVMLNKDPPPGFSPAKLRCCGHWRSSGRRPWTRNSRCEPRRSIGNYLYIDVYLYIHMYMYISVCVRALNIIYIYIYVYVCVCACMWALNRCVYIYIYKGVCVRARLYIHTYMYTSIHQKIKLIPICLN